jgi:colanic acid/amylovoran biosynthesis glycosyltransferase
MVDAAPMKGEGGGARGAGSSTRRRVAYVLTHYPQLCATFISDEVQALQALGFQVFPVAMNRPGPGDLGGTHERAERDRTFYLKAQGWRVLPALARALRASPARLGRTFWLAFRMAGLDLKAALWRFFHVVEAILVWDHCRSLGVRHLHAHFGLTPSTIAWFACTLGGAAEGWTWSFTIHGYQDFVNEREAALASKAASAHHVVCVSDFTRSQIMRVTHPRQWRKFHVVRCGIDLERFRFAPSERLAEVPTILVVGRLSAEKGHGVLLEAVSLLRREGCAAAVEFAGDGDLRPDLEAEAARLGLAERVRFLGGLHPSAIPERLRRADVFCLPSFSEGLPVSIMEAMAVGTAVVTTSIGGIPELAVDGETALVVPAGNAARLAEALARVLRDDELRRRLVQAARRRVERMHSLPVNVQLLAGLLDAPVSP